MVTDIRTRYVGGLRSATAVVLFVFGLVLSLPAQAPSRIPAIGDARPGDVLAVEYRERLSATAVDEAGIPLFEADSFTRPPAEHAVDVYLLWFLSTDAEGSPIRIYSRVYVPVLRLPTSAPVLAFGSGTTGIGDQCAPSREVPEEIRWGWYDANMLTYAGQGIVTIFPDYTGFNEPEVPQRYFSRLAEGRMMLDAHRAVRRLFDRQPGLIRSAVRPEGGAFTAGYSQGGHAALSAADLRDTYAPEVPLRGAIGFAPTTNVETLMREAAYYAPYIIYNYRDLYGSDRVRPAELLRSRWLPTLDADVLRMCVNDFQYYYPYDGVTLYTDAFYDALMSDTLRQRFPLFKQILDENIAGLSGHGLPVLLVQGNDDIIVSNEAQRLFADQLREAGSQVDYMERADVRHRHTRPAGFPASLAFIRRHADR